jgi:hypothetical protein
MKNRELQQVISRINGIKYQVLNLKPPGTLWHLNSIPWYNSRNSNNNHQ